MHHRRGHDLHDERITAGHTVTFEHLWYFLSRSAKTCASLPWGVTYANNSGDGIPNLSCVYFCSIASNNTCILHSPHTLRYSGRRESNALPKLTKGEPGVFR